MRKILTMLFALVSVVAMGQEVKVDMVGLSEQGQFRIVENTKNGEPHSIKNMIKCLQPK